MVIPREYWSPRASTFSLRMNSGGDEHRGDLLGRAAEKFQQQTAAKEREVRQLRHAAARKQHIRRLEVVVHAAVVVQILQTIAQTDDDVDAFLKVPRAIEDIPLQIRTVHVFHDHATAFFAVDEVHNLNKMRVFELLELLHAFGKVTNVQAAAEEVLVEEFQRGHFPFARIDAPVHAPGASFPQDTVEFVVIEGGAIGSVSVLGHGGFGILCLAFQIQVYGGGVSPHTVQIVEFSRFRTKDMEQDFSIVQ